MRSTIHYPWTWLASFLFQTFDLLIEFQFCFRNNNIWVGLYSYDSDFGYWQGTCLSLDFLFWAGSQTYSSSAPCTYMDSSDLRWHYDNCSNHHFVVCQIANGNYLLLSFKLNTSNIVTFGNIWDIAIKYISINTFNYKKQATCIKPLNILSSYFTRGVY